MAQSTALEPFPALNPSHHFVHRESPKTNTSDTRRRRKSSGLGGELLGDNDVAALATLSPSPTPASLSRIPPEKTSRHSKRRKAKKLLRRWKTLSIRHTWLNPLLACLIIVSLYLVNPIPSNPLSAALFLSYPLPREPGSDGPVQYGKGARDFVFVAFYTIFLSFTREFLMQRLVRPLAIRAGIRSRAKQSRFMEQFYTALYFGVFGPYGIYVMSRTPIWYFNTAAMYEDFPHKTHEGVFKAYYLLQASYWAQQMIVLLLMLEKPRKDFKELVAHHCITLSLIWLSYRFHFTYMGLAVYITHDISDFFLATSKTLNYIDAPFIGPYFFLFMMIWTYLRHFINLKILYSILTEFPSIGPFELNWETQQYKCWISQVITFSLLACLQAVNLFWFYLICRIAYRFVKTWGEEVEDVRSEYEDTEDEAATEEVAKPEQIETSKEPQTLKMNGSANGYANGKPNGKAIAPSPKVLLNGEPVPRTPSPADTPSEPDTIKSRLRERKKR